MDAIAILSALVDVWMVRISPAPDASAWPMVYNGLIIIYAEWWLYEGKNRLNFT